MSAPTQQKSAAKKKWKMPFAAFTGATQLEVITVIANCGHNTDLATDAIFKWIQAKQSKGRTRYEILGKLELMENKFLPFEALHDCFHLARRATGLPPSRILSGGVWYSSQASLHTLPEESTSEIEIAPLAETPTHDLVEANPDPQTSRSTDSEPPDWSISPVENIISESDALDFEGKRPPPLRLKNLLDARRSRMVRRHSIAASIPSSPPDEEEGTPTRRSPLLFTHLRRRSSLGSFNSRCATPTRPTWGAPSVAFDPPAPSMTYSDSSPDSGAEVDTPISRPSTSTGSYYTMTRTPSVTSFQVMDSVRQSFQQAKFDPEMAETLFRGATAQHFLRIFRAE